MLETCPLVFPLPGSHRVQHPMLAPRPTRNDLEGMLLIPFLYPMARSAVVSPTSGWHTPTTAGSWLTWVPRRVMEAHRVCTGRRTPVPCLMSGSVKTKLSTQIEAFQWGCLLTRGIADREKSQPQAWQPHTVSAC